MEAWQNNLATGIPKYLLNCLQLGSYADKHYSSSSISSNSNIIMRAGDGKNFNWLTVMPIAHHHFDLSAVEFRDALAMRYGRPLMRMPATCNGCGAPFDLVHALHCKKGGLVTQHHEVRDALGDIAALAFKEVTREPIVN